MGICLSEIFKKKERKSSKLFGTVFPSPFLESQIESVMARHDDKFYFIPNEDDIDQTIEYLDEDGPSEANYGHLNSLLSQLKNLHKRYNPQILPNNQGQKSNKASVAIEEEHETPEFNQKELVLPEADTNIEIDINEPKFEKVTQKKETQKPNNQLTTSTANKKQIRVGELIMEIQAAKFLYPDYLKKHKLQKPYVVVRIYRYQHNSKYLQNINEIKEKGQIVKTFETLKYDDNISPYWGELIEHKLNDEDIIKNYFIGICLFYTIPGKSSPSLIGEELFSLSSFLDQRLQAKEIDYRNHTQKGVLAKLKVRFQLIYDLPDVKERLTRDLHTRIHRLYKIREKYQQDIPMREERTNSYQPITHSALLGDYNASIYEPDGQETSYQIE